MRIVDTHCHAAPGWYEPVESLLFQMDRNGVDHALLVQINGQTNNEYQFECVGRYPDRLSSVVIVDTDRPDAPQELERLVARGARGLRLRPPARSPGDDPIAIWRRAAELGIPVTCGGSGREFASDAFAELIAALPALAIIVEHLGSVNNPDGEGPPYDVRRKVFALARFPNVYIKIHGLGEFAERAMPVRDPFPFVEPIPPLLEQAYEAFGPSRMLWGSDYPPVSGREGYANALRFPMERFADKSDEQRALIFGGTAASLYRLDG
jgi:L-fuconolactonase